METRGDCSLLYLRPSQGCVTGFPIWEFWASPVGGTWDLLAKIIEWIIEWFGLEGTWKTTQFQPPCRGQGPLPPAQAAPSPVQPGLGPWQGGGSDSFSGQPGPGPHDPHSEEFPPYVQPKSPLFQFKAITPWPIATGPAKKSFSSSLAGCFRYWWLL